MRSHRYLLPLGLVVVVALSCLGSGAEPGRPEQRFDDEPNELSWEYLAGSLSVFEMYEKLVTAAGVEPRNPAPPGRMFATLKIPGTALAATARWKAGNDRSRAVLIGPAGHVGPAARRMIDVPVDGHYRLWIRWKNSPPGNSSTRVRLRPAAMAEFTHGWQTLAEADYLDLKIGFVPKDRPDYACDFRRDVAGMVWQCSPCVSLRHGPALLEVLPIIHAGPYAPRVIEQIWLTNDTITRPSDDDAMCPVPADVHLEKTRRGPRHAARWSLYEGRPGACSGPSASSTPVRPPAQEAFRRTLIDRLARDEGLSADERHMAQLTYFDERWNLIGTPRQVRERIDAMGDPQNQMHGYAQWIEAESFTIDRGWSSDPHNDTSEGAALCAAYGDGPALGPSKSNFRSFGARDRMRTGASMPSCSRTKRIGLLSARNPHWLVQASRRQRNSLHSSRRRPPYWRGQHSMTTGSPDCRGGPGPPLPISPAAYPSRARRERCANRWSCLLVPARKQHGWSG